MKRWMAIMAAGLVLVAGWAAFHLHRRTETRAVEGVQFDPEVMALLEAGKLEDAKETLIAKIRAKPEDLDLRRTWVLVFLKLERLPEAFVVYREKLSPAGQPDDPVLEATMHSRDPDVRRETAAILSLLKTPTSVDRLIDLTRDENERVRGAAATALGETNEPGQPIDPRVEAALKRMLADDPAWSARYDASTALARAGEAEPLFQGLTDKDSSVYSQSRKELLEMIRANPKKYGPLFVKYMRDPDPKIAEVGVVGLGLTRDYESTPIVLEWLGSPDPKIRVRALKVLYFSQDPRALGEVRKALDDADPEVQATAAAVAGQYRDSESVEKLKLLAQAKDAAVKQAAEAALTQIQAAGNR